MRNPNKQPAWKTLSEDQKERILAAMGLRKDAIDKRKAVNVVSGDEKESSRRSARYARRQGRR